MWFVFGKLIFKFPGTHFRQKLETEKVAREKAEGERKRLEEEIANLKLHQETQARGITWNYV